MASPETGIPQIIQRAETSSLSFIETPQWARELQTSGLVPKELVIADPTSLCAGVERAKFGTNDMFEEYPNETVWFFHVPIHNDTYLAEIEARGGKIAMDIREVPFRAPVLLSAHGVSPEIWLYLKQNQNKGKDATCPLVDKTHREIVSLAKDKYRIFVVGDEKHDEMQGLIGEAPGSITVINPKAPLNEVDQILNRYKMDKIALRNQTTLAVVDLLGLIAHVQESRPDVNLAKKSDICYATQNRQESIISTIEVAGAKLAIVFGSDETKRSPSGNSIRLREVAKGHGANAYLVENISEIKSEWFVKNQIVGVSAGASAAPERIVEFLGAMRSAGLRNDQIKKITVADEPMTFAAVKSFDFSKAA